MFVILKYCKAKQHYLMKTKSKDHLSPQQRSRQMAKVTSKDTKPEKLVRSILHKEGFRFRKNVKSLPGVPDIVLPKYKTVIFVHGCFWHQHDCKRGNRMPSNRREYWEKKLQRNAERDLQHQKDLEKAGWEVIIIWECELKKKSNNVEQVIEYLRSKLL